MARTSYRLTQHRIKELCDRLKAGAFDHVACESLGIPYHVYQRWLSLGQQDNPRPLHQELYQAVLQAKAHARFVVEMQMRTEQPKVWLLQGPGRETPTRPGWTTPARSNGRDGRVSPLHLQPEILALVTAILQTLKPFPEARTALAQTLAATFPPEVLPSQDANG